MAEHKYLTAEEAQKIGEDSQLHVRNNWWPQYAWAERCLRLLADLDAMRAELRGKCARIEQLEHGLGEIDREQDAEIERLRTERDTAVALNQSLESDLSAAMQEHAEDVIELDRLRKALEKAYDVLWGANEINACWDIERALNPQAPAPRKPCQCPHENHNDAGEGECAVCGGSRG